jgi:glutamate mutase epsilon subunit
VDQLALASATRKHLSVASRRSFDEHLLASPDARLVLAQGRAVEHRLESLEALLDHVGRHEVVAVISAARVPGRGEKMKV